MITILYCIVEKVENSGTSLCSYNHGALFIVYKLYILIIIQLQLDIGLEVTCVKIAAFNKNETPV